MKKMLSFGLILAVVLSFSFTDAGKKNAQPGKWVVLGKRVVNFSVDHDEFPVTVTKGTFKKDFGAIIPDKMVFDLFFGKRVFFLAELTYPTHKSL